MRPYARRRARGGRTDVHDCAWSLGRRSGPPVTADGLDHPSGVGEVPEPFVDPGAAFASGLHQVRDGHATRPGRDQSGPHRRFGIAVDVVGGAGRIFARLRPFWRHGSRLLRIGAGGELAGAVFAGVSGDRVVIDQVGACAFGLGVLGIGDQEFTGPGQGVRMPSGVE